MKTPESTLFLGGGGSKEKSAPLDAEFVKHIRATRSDVANVAYIPVAMDQRQDKHPYDACLAWFEETFAGQFDVVDMWTDLSQIRLDDLRNKGAVYVGGGDTDVLLQKIRTSGFDALLKQFLEEGGTYYGGSAGAIILGKDIRTATEVRARQNPIVNDFAGLDLLQGHSVFPHYKAENAAEVQRLVTELASPIIALPEEGGMIMQGGTTRVIGSSASLFDDHGATELAKDSHLEFPNQ